MKEAEIQYKLGLEIDKNDPLTHYNYGLLLSKINHMEEAEVQYKLALKTDIKIAAIFCDYGKFLQRMGRSE